MKSKCKLDQHPSYTRLKKQNDDPVEPQDKEDDGDETDDEDEDKIRQ